MACWSACSTPSADSTLVSCFRMPKCSSDFAAIPMATYTRLPSPQSKPCGKCMAVTPVCLTSSRVSVVPCGIAIPLPR
ncbi:Uncharacterised protein [Vibrio cholerae]|nr:Uncharacterised protein [Vibrio cholerae]